MHIAAAQALRGQLLPALDRLETRPADQGRASGRSVVKIGRTHLQDAAPLTLGQEFSGYAAQLQRCRARLEWVCENELLELAQGGTAVGTGLNAPPGSMPPSSRRSPA